VIGKNHPRAEEERGILVPGRAVGSAARAGCWLLAMEGAGATRSRTFAGPARITWSTLALIHGCAGTLWLTVVSDLPPTYLIRRKYASETQPGGAECR
jgi:hypothetical protein